MSSPVSSTNTSSRFAGAALALGRPSAGVVDPSTATDVPVRRVAKPVGAPLGLGLREPRRRPVDLDRLAAGVLGDELGRRPGGDRLPVRHDRDGVAEALGLLDVVRRHQDRDALAAQPVDQRPQLLAHLRVQPDGRLVEQHEPRLVDQRAGDQQPPAHAARELVDLRVAAVGEVRDVERALDRRRALGASGRGRGGEHDAGSARRSASCRGCRAAARRPSRRARPSSAAAARGRAPRISPSSAIACAVSTRIVVDLPRRWARAGRRTSPRDLEVEAVDGGDRPVALDHPAQADRESIGSAPRQHRLGPARRPARERLYPPSPCPASTSSRCTGCPRPIRRTRRSSTTSRWPSCPARRSACSATTARASRPC